jgi:hypothetical protein
MWNLSLVEGFILQFYAVNKFVSSRFSANLEDMYLVLSWLSVALPFVLGHPLLPVHPRFEDTQQYFMVNFSENFRDRVHEALPTLTFIIRWFSFGISEEDEITVGQTWAVTGCHKCSALGASIHF